MSETITVRKISFGQGVERIFPVHAPVVDHIDVVRTGQVRRAKLYYLRGLKGKAARLERETDSRYSSCRAASARSNGKQGPRLPALAGVDEAGRGSIFGPVFAAAVMLSPDIPIRGLRDSKILSPERREALATRIRRAAISWAVGAADAYEIDRINIYQASRLAMKRAMEKLLPAPGFLLMDAMRIDLPFRRNR